MVNQLFLWPFSIAMLLRQRVKLTFPHENHPPHLDALLVLLLLLRAVIGRCCGRGLDH